MPPKKKSKKSTTPKTKKKPLEPLEHLSEVRERAVKVLIKSEKNENVNYDIEQNIREIRAILATNTEIFDICMTYLDNYHDPGDGNMYVFERVNFNLIKTIPDENNKFVVIPSRTELAFDMSSLINPPSGLEDIIIIKRISKFIDYTKAYESALLLHDDILEPVLAKIKDKLMDIQVCLGKIDTWVIEPQKCLHFLENTFGKYFECNRRQYESYGIWKVSCSCEIPEVYLHPTFRELDIRCGSCRGDIYTHNLKEFENVESKYEATFDIRKEKEQNRLIKLLELLDMEEAENKGS